MELSLEEFFLKRYGNDNFAEIWRSFDRIANIRYPCHVMSLLYNLGQMDIIVDLKEFFDYIKCEEIKYCEYEKYRHIKLLKKPFYVEEAIIDFLTYLPTSEKILSYFTKKDMKKRISREYKDLTLKDNEFGNFVLRDGVHFSPQVENKIIKYHEFEELKYPLEIKTFVDNYHQRTIKYVNLEVGQWNLKREIFEVA
jgi:hypothetical protein